MPPRIAESFATRVKRASPCPSRKPSSSNCRSTARASSATAINTSMPSTHRRRVRNCSCEKLRLLSLRIIAICDRCSWACSLSGRRGFHDPHFVGPRNHHAQIDARGLLDPPVGRPGALLELQLAPFDFERVALAVQALQLNEEAAGLVLGRDDADCRGGHRQCDHCNASLESDAHAATLSATRSTLLRARGLAATSSADG